MTVIKFPSIGSMVRYSGDTQTGACVAKVIAHYPEVYDAKNKKTYEAYIGIQVINLPRKWPHAPGMNRFGVPLSKVQKMPKGRAA